jgi:LysR family transcriptional regulator, low CO2-responsive transcriptional regulator
VLGFPLMLHWYVVHRRAKRLPPVAQAFKDFLLADGAALIERIVPFGGPADPDSGSTAAAPPRRG